MAPQEKYRHVQPTGRVLTRAYNESYQRMHAEKAAACQDVEAALLQFRHADAESASHLPFLTVFGARKFAPELMKVVYDGAKYQVMVFECKRRHFVTLYFGQIPSVIKTIGTMEEALGCVGRVLNEAIFDMMASGDAMYRLPNKGLLFYPMEGWEREDTTFYTADVPVVLESPTTLQRSDLVPYFPSQADGNAA